MRYLRANEEKGLSSVTQLPPGSSLWPQSAPLPWAGGPAHSLPLGAWLLSSCRTGSSSKRRAWCMPECARVPVCVRVHVRGCEKQGWGEAG